jgi:hypothetical protein
MAEALPRSRAGEVVVTGTTEFEAQAVELHRAPPLGALVTVRMDDGCRLYGVVAGAYTEGLDTGARPVPRATDARQNADVYRDNPDLEHVLRTCFRCLVVGFHDGHQVRHYLPAAPAPIHYSVAVCDAQEIRAFTEDFGYFPLLLNARNLPVEEVLAAHVRFVAEGRPGRGDRETGDDTRIRAGRDIAALLRDDHPRLRTVLDRIRPEPR